MATKIVRNLVGPQVRRARTQLDLTQEDLAAKLQRAGWDVSRASLAKIEAQLRWVADAELYLLAEVLGMTMVDLFPGANVVKAFVGSPEFKRN